MHSMTRVVGNFRSLLQAALIPKSEYLQALLELIYDNALINQIE